MQSNSILAMFTINFCGAHYKITFFHVHNRTDLYVYTITLQ